MRRFWVALVMLVCPCSGQASFGAPDTGPFDDPDVHFVHTLASTSGVVLSIMTVPFVCGALMLPLDLYQEIRHPETEFSQRFGTPVCSYPTAAAYIATYFVVGFPFYLLKVTFWDVPRRFWWQAPSPPVKEEGPPPKPERLPTTG